VKWINAMGNKFKNKYRIETTRLRSWNYAWNGAYFITICTRNWEHYLGEIKNGEMCLTKIGTIAHKYWQGIPVHFPFVKLGEFVVMPNHVHGIIIIDKQDVIMDMMGDNNNDKNNRNNIETQNHMYNIIKPDEMRNDDNVETQNFASLRKFGLFDVHGGIG